MPIVPQRSGIGRCKFGLGETVAEQMVEANGVELCTEPFGDPADRPILLVMGTGASMLWWDESFCRMLADDGRFVIRYDHRPRTWLASRPAGRSRSCWLSTSPIVSSRWS
jgi:hypothetical protein